MVYFFYCEYLELIITNQEKIARINELAKKSREVGLTDEEKLEQQLLRNEYRAAIRASLTATLDNIEFKES